MRKPKNNENFSEDEAFRYFHPQNAFIQQPGKPIEQQQPLLAAFLQSGWEVSELVEVAQLTDPPGTYYQVKTLRRRKHC